MLQSKRSVFFLISLVILCFTLIAVHAELYSDSKAYEAGFEKGYSEGYEKGERNSRGIYTKELEDYKLTVKNLQRKVEDLEAANNLLSYNYNVVLTTMICLIILLSALVFVVIIYFFYWRKKAPSSLLYCKRCGHQAVLKDGLCKTCRKIKRLASSLEEC